MTRPRPTHKGKDDRHRQQDGQERSRLSDRMPGRRRDVKDGQEFVKPIHDGHAAMISVDEIVVDTQGVHLSSRLKDMTAKPAAARTSQQSMRVVCRSKKTEYKTALRCAVGIQNGKKPRRDKEEMRKSNRGSIWHTTVIITGPLSHIYIMSVPTFHPTPNIEKGVRYWQGVPATVDGVLGGYGNGTLPIVDAQGSRTFLLEMLPRLGAVAPASASSSATTDVRSDWLQQRIAQRGGPGRARTRALDCGAGVGRVTRDVLSRLVDIVHIVEPVDSFLDEAKKQSHTWTSMTTPPSKAPLEARKAIHFHLSTLQTFDPARPYSSATHGQAELSKKQKRNGNSVRRYEPTLSVGDKGREEEQSQGAQEAVAQNEPIVFDVVWGQWCLQHLSDKDLIAFLERAKSCLRPADAELSSDVQAQTTTNAVLDGAGIIVVKENVLRESEDGSERVWYDEEDHSITRTPNAYERVFRQAGLEIVKTDVQRGLPDELFPVQMWCLRIPRNKH